MVTFVELPRPYHIVFIDEAGDPGLTKVRPLDPDGASEWLVLGAIVIDARDEAATVDWVRAIRYDLKDTQGPDLHFRTLSDHRRQLVAQAVTELPLDGFVLASHKPNMKGHRNPAAEAVSVTPTPRGWFYNWCIRLLIERVSSACAQASINECGKPMPIQLVFSQRGGTAYNWLRVYFEVLSKQARNSTTVLSKREIKYEVIFPHLITSVLGKQSAGCQLADVVTSAFHAAVDANGPRWNTRAAEILRPCMATEFGFYEDCGVSLQPTPLRFTWARLSQNQRKIFHHYKFNFG